MTNTEHDGIFCEACQGDRKECGPMRDTPTGWIGLRHLPNLGKLADRRHNGR